MRPLISVGVGVASWLSFVLVAAWSDWTSYSDIALCAAIPAVGAGPSFWIVSPLTRSLSVYMSVLFGGALCCSALAATVVPRDVDERTIDGVVVWGATFATMLAWGAVLAAVLFPLRVLLSTAPAEDDPDWV